jgi:hypothetical protein
VPDYNPKPNYVPEPDHVPEPDYVPETYQPDLYVANDYGQAGPYCQFCEDKDVVIDDVTCKETSEFVCTKEQPTEEYGPKVTVCRPVPKKNCYTVQCYRTPRTVSVMKMLNMIILMSSP